jgi:7-cyano-7-deazaguanine reductase
MLRQWRIKSKARSIAMTTPKRDQTEHLRVLGGGKLPAPSGPPGANLLEAFPNLFPHRNYIIRIAYPEFTSLCPVTGQPDFANIVVEYVPDALCVESKSFKLYMTAFRNHNAFMETIANSMLDDLCAVLAPRWCRINGLFAPRGGTRLHVFAEQFKELTEEEMFSLKEQVNAWKHEARPYPS